MTHAFEHRFLTYVIAHLPAACAEFDGPRKTSAPTPLHEQVGSWLQDQLLLERCPWRRWSVPSRITGNLFALRLRCSDSGKPFMVHFRLHRGHDKHYAIERILKRDHAAHGHTHRQMPTVSVPLSLMRWNGLHCPYCQPVAEAAPICWGDPVA